MFWNFRWIKFTFSYFELNLIIGQFLETNLHFITHFTLRGQNLDEQQPIEKWSLKHDPFLFVQHIFTYSKNRHCNISLFRVCWRYNRVSVCFSHSKTMCNDSKQITWIFFSDRGTAVNVVSFAVTFSPTKERVPCVTRPKNGWEGDYSMWGTNAVYFCSQVFKQQRK